MAWVNCQAPFQNYELLQLTASGLAKIGNQYAVWDNNDFDLTTGTSASLEVYPTEPWSLAVHDGIIGYQVDHDSASTYWLNYLYPAPTPYFYVRKDQLSESFKFVMCVNMETETALLGIKFNNGLFNILVDAVFYDDALNYLNPLPTYTWQSVPSVSGKNGISLLSIIKSSAINSGDAVTGASADAFDRLEESTKISALIQGISEETPIIYSDDVNYMSITPTANNTCTLKFYLHGNVIYTLTDVNINAYLSFLIDEANGIMKPSIIYEDS